MSDITDEGPETVTEPLEVADEAVAPPKHAAWALVLICIAQLMVVLDATIANIALPFIGKDLDIVGTTSLTWIVTAYALAFGGLLLLGGRLGDLYGRRRIFMTGLSVFAIASLLGGLAQNEALLLGARGLQGVGAALASPAALSLITTTFPPGPLRNRAMAMYATMSGVGAAIGLILGGWLTGSDFSIFGADVHGWRMTFLINVPIGLGAALFAPRVLRESEKHAGELDLPGAVTATGGLLAVVYGLTRAGNQDYGWGDQWTVTALVVGVILLAVFAFVETRVEHPMLPFRLFANRTRATSFVVMMIMPAAMFAMFFFLSLYIQNVMGFSPLETGFAFLPFSVGMIISAGTVSQLVTRFDPRYISGIGSMMAAAALFGFSRLSVDDSARAVLSSGPDHPLGASVNYWTEILPFVFLMSLGMGAVFVPLMMTALHRVEAHDSGIGSGVLNTMQQVGGALGLAVLSTVGAHFANKHDEVIRGDVANGLANLPDDRLRGLFEALGVSNLPDAVDRVVTFGSFPEGAAKGFLVGAFMMLTGSLIIWTFLNVKHTELQTEHDGPVAVH